MLVSLKTHQRHTCFIGIAKNLVQSLGQFVLQSHSHLQGTGEMFVRSRQRKGTVENYFNFFNLPLVQQLKQQPDFAGIFVVFPSNNGAKRNEMCLIAAHRRKGTACLPALQRLFWLTVLVRDQSAATSPPTCILNCSQNCCKHILRGAGLITALSSTLWGD